jgi:hypothetical protein
MRELSQGKRGRVAHMQEDRERSVGLSRRIGWVLAIPQCLQISEAAGREKEKVKEGKESNTALTPRRWLHY